MHIGLHEMIKLWRMIFKEDCKVESIEQLHGGAQKVVYRVTGDDGFTCILYVWDWSKNFVLAHQANPESESYGAELFQYNANYLKRIGARVPEVYYMDRTKTNFPYDFAIVEDVGNIDLTEFISANPEQKLAVLRKLDKMLRQMHAHHARLYGPLYTAERMVDQTVSCEQIMLKESLEDIDYLEEHVPSIAENKERLIKKLMKLYKDVSPRKRYGIIHGELGPDHIRVDSKGNPILIDIEGCKFFDIEYEHAFLEFRFGENYLYIRNDELDPKRMLFYKLHLHLAYSAGPIQIIKNGFPDADSMKDIVKAALQILS